MTATRIGGPVVGVDFGGTGLVAAAVAESGEVVDRVTLPSPAQAGGTELVRQVRDLVATRWPEARAVGMGAAGVIDPDSGVVLEASDSFARWRGFPLRTELAAATALPVAIANDVNAFLIGECRFGAARNRADCLGVMLGTGVGGAIVLDGRLHGGRRGAAGELGHMPGFGDAACTCGGVGHLETIASGRSIARRYAAATQRNDITQAAQVARAADAGDAVAMRCFEEAGATVALAVVQAATLFDVDAVVLGGGVTRAWRFLEPAIRGVVAQHQLISGATLSVSLSRLGADAVLLGAAGLALAEMTGTRENRHNG